MLFGLLTESIYAFFVDLHEVVLNTDRCNALFWSSSSDQSPNVLNSDAPRKPSKIIFLTPEHIPSSLLLPLIHLPSFLPSPLSLLPQPNQLTTTPLNAIAPSTTHPKQKQPKQKQPKPPRTKCIKYPPYTVPRARKAI